MLNNKEIRFSRRASRLKSSLIRELLELTRQPGVISFAGGLPASDLMPEIAIAHLPDALRQYGTTDGDPGFRQAVAGLVSDEGLACSAENVLATSGSQQGIDLIAKLFIDEDTLVFVEKPTYLAALQVFGLYGARIVGIDIQADGIDLDALSAKLKLQNPALLYINPTFQNPTGYSYSDEKREQLASLLDQHNVPLVEDNPYGNLRFEGESQRPVCSWLESAPWAYLGSFSKIAIPAWRIGYMVSDPRLAQLFVKIKQGTDLHTNRPGQWWCEEFMQDKIGFTAHIERLRHHYTLQRDAMQQALETHFTDIADWEVPRGGLFYWLTFKADINTADFLAKALENQVAFLPGSAFYPEGEQCYGSIRLSFSEAGTDKIQQGIARLAKVFKEL